jgi:hypothetical protein
MLRRRIRAICATICLLSAAAAVSAFSNLGFWGSDSFMINETCTSGAYVTFETEESGPAWIEWGCDDENDCSDFLLCSVPYCTGTLENLYSGYYFMVEISSGTGGVDISDAGCK